MKKSKFREEQIGRVLSEAARSGKSRAKVCKKDGISPNTFYVCKREYSGLQTDDKRRLHELERETDELKRQLAELGPRSGPTGRCFKALFGAPE